MSISPDVRHQLDDALRHSPAFHALSPAEQQQMARNLASVMTIIAPSDGGPEASPLATGGAASNIITEGERAAARIAEARSAQQIAAERQQTARTVADRQYRLDQGRLADQYALKQQEMDAANDGEAAASAATQFSNLTSHVDFGSFVKSLISNVYDAIVRSSIEQMQSYAKLLESVVGPASQFAGTIPSNDAANYLVSMFPNALQMTTDGKVASRDGSDSDTLDASKVGGPKQVDLTDSDALQKLVELAKLHMAKQNQHLLATMVMMGIDRIVVTDGQINARVKIQASGKNSYTSEDLAQQQQIGAGMGALPTASGSNLDQSASITVGTGAGQSQTASQNYVQDDAELYGSVNLNFKSQVMPLDDIAADGTVQKLKSKQADGQKRYAGRGPSGAAFAGPRGTSTPERERVYGRPVSSHQSLLPSWGPRGT